MIHIDGAIGEGGGQVVRTALGLSLATGEAVEIERIRAGRPNPGLARQHLAALRAATEIGEAEVEGDEPGSRKLVFRPRTVRPGEYRFSIGSAGSTTLVLQTVLPPLLTAGAATTLVLEGGTHNPFAPPYEFLEEVFGPRLRRMGPTVALELDRHGFYPAGGGRFRARITPTDRLSPLTLEERGPVRRISARAVVSALPDHIAHRELTMAAAILDIPPGRREAVEVEDPMGPGNVIMIRVESEGVTELFTGFGRKGVPAEEVAREAAEAARDYLDAGVPVGPHLADQLLLPLALAGGGAFRTVPPTPHARTHAEVIRRFLDVEIRMEPEAPGERGKREEPEERGAPEERGEPGAPEGAWRIEVRGRR